MMRTPTLPMHYVQEVCKASGGSTICRYLNSTYQATPRSFNPLPAIIYNCLKGSQEANYIDNEVESYLRDCQRQYENPNRMTMPIGNNCDGFTHRSNFGAL